MTPYELIEARIREGMYDGNRHKCKITQGRLAGGYYASGDLTGPELFALEELACSLSDSPAETKRQWDKAVNFGREEPLTWNEGDYRVADTGKNLEWNGEVPLDDNYKIVRSEWIQNAEVDEPGDENWNPGVEITRYLRELFEPDDQVGYVTEAWFNEKSSKFLPKSGVWDRTAGELIAELDRYKDRPNLVFGDSNPQVGAWIRFNPMDGHGCKDENITHLRYALVESDVVEIPKQLAIMKQIELPIATLVHSGGKSLHAVVKVDANSMEEYRERVDFLYEVCAKNGLEMDRQNRNPSRLSRMPGVMRNGNKQWLLDTNLGKSTWGEWKEWIEDYHDDLPDIEKMEFVNEEDLAEEQIKGILRKGHKLLLSGPSKAGKSFCLKRLAVAIAHGTDWLGWDCVQGDVLYVNLELDSRSSGHRFLKIHEELGLANNGRIDVWNLRGNSATMDKLAPKLIRKAEKKGYAMIIIDPIYKVLTGDENSAEEMAHFCNQFDKIAVKLGASVVYCHHHSKGSQGQKSSRDRSSGSGVFARDPDAILDLIELIIDEDRRKAITNAWERDWLQNAFTEDNKNWYDDVSQDDCLVSQKLQDYAIEKWIKYDAEAFRMESFKASIASGWRIEGTLREFASPPAKEIFFRYPVHIVDHESLLKDAKAEGEEPPRPWKEKRKSANKEAKMSADEKFAFAYEANKDERGNISVKQLAEILKVSEKTVRTRASNHDEFTNTSGVLFRKEEEQKS